MKSPPAFRSVDRSVEVWLGAFARVCPDALKTPPSPDLRRACSALQGGGGRNEIDPEDVIAVSAVIGVATGFTVALLLTAFGSRDGLLSLVTVTGPISAVAGVSVALAVRRVPVLAAGVVRTRAVADATAVVGTVALSLRLVPVPERAVRFAASAGDGPLHRSLRRHTERAAVTGDPDAGMTSFAEEWHAWFPALNRSVSLIGAAVRADAGEDRTRLLDRAVTVVEEDLRDRSASFAGELRGPVTGLYAFGVLLPLALVGTLPAAVAAGVPVPPPAFALLYAVVLPLALVVAAGKLLLRRPVAFPAPRIGRDHPAVTDRRAEALLGGVAVGGAGWLIAPLVTGAWASPVAASGLGIGTALVVVLHPIRAVRRTVDERERSLSDALALLGRRVAVGESVELALPRVAETLSGPTGAALSTAVRRRRALGVTVERALAGEGGPFGPRRAGGSRTTGAVSAVVAAVSEGRPAGDALVAHAERLDLLAEAERAARRELATVTSTLRDTAALFGPLVGGATVALAGRLEGLGGLGSAVGAGGGLPGAAGGTATLSAAFVGPVVGAYALALAAILTALATGLERGLDATLVGYRVGIALIAATGAFLAGHASVATLVG